MKQVGALYEALVSDQKVTAIRRFNLRRFCRSFDMPPVGISFWQLDDVNWDFLSQLNQALIHERFIFRGGEHFPRMFFDTVVFGLDRRIEFIYLTTNKQQHADARTFMQHAFHAHVRDFGDPDQAQSGDLSAAARGFRNNLTMDIIHFADHPEMLSKIADFHLCLTMAAHLPQVGDPTRDEVFQAFKQEYPQYRADVTRITTTAELTNKLDDMLHFLNRLPDSLDRP